MTGKRFQISGSMVEDTKNIIPPTLWQIDEQKKKYCDELNYLYEENQELREINEWLWKEINDLRSGVLDSIRESYDIECSCNPCVVEECVKRVVE